MFISVHLWFPSSAFAQEDEVVANLSTGRVVIFVAKEGIVVGSVTSNAEPDSRPPQMVEMGGRRMAIVLGATEWLTPGMKQSAVRVEKELGRWMTQAPMGRRQVAEVGAEATDVEAIGIAVTEGLRPVVARLHHKIDLGSEEPLVEMLLIGYAQDYGPEVWSLRFRITQEPLRGDYWRTRILHPQYIQLWPPEKGQPKTLVEVQFPPSAKEPTVADMLERNDSRLERLKTSDPPLQRASERLSKGEANKTAREDASAFLRAALGAIAPSQDDIALGVMSEQRGFAWMLAPKEPVQRAEEPSGREPGAPSLRKKPPV